MAEDHPVALIAGVSGIAGRGIARHLLSLGWTVTGLSRQAPLPSIDGLRHLPVDLRDAEAVTRALAEAGRGVSHLFYCGRAPDPDPQVEADRNLGMLANVVTALQAAGAPLGHVHLVHGGKWYGSHLGPYRTPAEEDDPRPSVANFYYDQQDWIAERAARSGFTWTATRPHVLTGFSLGYPHNIASVLAVHGTLCRLASRPMTFPGHPGCFESVSQLTDVRLLVQAVHWCATTPAAANDAFNVINSDYFRWRDVWPDIAAVFDLEAGPVETASLVHRFATADGTWRRLAAQKGLLEPDIARVASGAYGDTTLSVWWDDMCSNAKIRRLGFDPVFTSRESLLNALVRYRENRVVP